MNRRQTTVSPIDSSPVESEFGVESFSVEGERELDRRNFRRTNLGVRIIAFHAAYKSFFFKDLIRDGFRSWTPSSPEGGDIRSTKAL